MAKHRLLVVGAGRIGAEYRFEYPGYSHAGAARALRDRVELVGFAEPDLERRVSANMKWKVPTYDSVQTALSELKPDIVSVCVQPEQQQEVFGHAFPTVKGFWCEKPFVSFRQPPKLPIQVNYLRRGDADHQRISKECPGGQIIVYAKDDIHTRCHFEDLADWWKAHLVYRKYDGPCSYLYTNSGPLRIFDLGGCDPAPAMKAMLGNLLDHIDKGEPLWSPP